MKNLRTFHPNSRYGKASAQKRVIALSVLEMGAVLETKTRLRPLLVALIILFLILLASQ